MKVVIAGGIGSGKSVVTEILRSLGAKVVVADEINRELLNDSDYVSQIENIFPSVVYNNVIDKKKLSELVYHDEGKRRMLMDIAHPLILKRMFAVYPKEALVFYEIPLLSELRRDLFDRVWYVSADREVRVSRITMRDNVSIEYANHLIDLQGAEDKLAAIADVVIDNSGERTLLCGKVKALYCSILDEIL